MLVYDFLYDGIKLSDMGYMICSFDGSGDNEVSSGSKITFNTVSTLNGIKWELTSSEYKECLSATFSIMKKPCGDTVNNLEISANELRQLSRWLNRSHFHKFNLLNEEYQDYYTEGSFNLERVEIMGVTYGVNLSLETNRPFFIHEPVSIQIENTSENGTYVIDNTSDAEGYIYPNMEITCNADGDLTITNSINNRTMEIKDCTAGEVITINYPIITSSVTSHIIQNAFNWEFLRLENTYYSQTNVLTFSIPCTINMNYSPTIKLGLI
jgi:hypothetical protein